MANDSKQPISNIGTNGFIWLPAVAAGTFFVANKLPLEGSRPPTTERSLPERPGGAQNVDARLWQDPFVAVGETLARSPELKLENCRANEAPVTKVPATEKPATESQQAKSRHPKSRHPKSR